MIVVADNSPLSALAEIGLLEILPALYGTISTTVYNEATHERAPALLRNWIQAQPPWVNILPDPQPLVEVSSLDAGEAAAISLAWQYRHEALIIVDDRAARRVCESLAIACTGTAGILMVAARSRLIDFEEAISRLQSTSFRISQRIVDSLRGRL